jgi:hypothetical protein
MFYIWSCQLRQASADHRFDTYYGTTKARYQIYSGRNIMAYDDSYQGSRPTSAHWEKYGLSVLVHVVDENTTSLEQSIREY